MQDPISMPAGLADMMVDRVMKAWPSTVPVFVRHRMACIGCLMAPFMTVREAAREHLIDPAILVADLRAEINHAESAEVGS